MSQIHITVSSEQASAIVHALDFYSRMCIGQIEEVAYLVRSETIPLRRDAGEKRAPASVDQCEQVDELLNSIKAVLGYPRNGSNGIGHRHVHIDGLRAYEVQKVLSKTLAELRNPNPDFRGVDYDGLGPRYTQDVEPRSWVE